MIVGDSGSEKKIANLSVLHQCFYRIGFIRQNLSYSKIEISSKMLQHKRKTFIVTQTLSIALLPITDGNVGHSDGVSFLLASHYTLFFLPFYCPLSFLILLTEIFFNIALHTLNIFLVNLFSSIFTHPLFASLISEKERKTYIQTASNHVEDSHEDTQNSVVQQTKQYHRNLDNQKVYLSVPASFQ